jgi:phage/plasmid-associated DNA primase
MGWKAFGTYATSLDPASLKADEHGGDRPRSDLLDLRGKRFVVMPEVGSGAVFDGALFKSMFSGGDRKKMRGQHQRHAIDMEFTHMLWSSGNRPYGVSSEDDATWNERFCFVRFEHQVPADDRDDREEDSIVNSVDACSAFITAAVEGFTRLYRDKRGELAPPDFIQHETDTVRETLDPYTAILEPGDPDEQMVEFTGNRKDGVLASELWFWVKDARSEQLGGRMRRVNDEKYAFGQAMIRRKAKLVRSQSRFGNKEYWRGVRWVEGFAKRAGVTAPDWTDEGASDDDEKAT